MWKNMALKIGRLALPILSLAILVTAAPATGLAASAKENFNWYCVQCHGSDGGGDGVNSTVKQLPVGPMNLAKPKEMKKFSNEQVIRTLTKGGPANQLESLMPPWGNTLSKAEIKALMKYVRSLCKGAECRRE